MYFSEIYFKLHLTEKCKYIWPILVDRDILKSIIKYSWLVLVFTILIE